MMNPSTDPVSSMGLAVQNKTQGMTPEQVQQAAVQAQKDGLASFDQIMTLKQRLDALKQAGPAQPPPSSTVMGDMQAEMGGIADLPVNIANPQNYSRGGVVAFAEGGAPRSAIFGDFGMNAPPRSAVSGDVGMARTAAAGDVGMDAAAAAERIREANAAAEAAAATGGKAAGQTVFRRMLGSAARFFPIKHPLVTAALIAAPFAYDYFFGDEAPVEEAPEEPTAPEAPAERVDVSQFLNDAQKMALESSAKYSGAAGPYVDPGRFYAAPEALLREQYANTKPQDQAAIDAEVAKRYAGTDAYLTQREGQLDKRGERIEAQHAPDFWNALATGLFSMGKAGGEDGATFFGAASEGGLRGMEARLASKKEYLSQKDALDDARFQTGEARANRQTNLLGKGEAERQSQQARNDAALSGLASLQTTRAGTQAQAYDNYLSRQAQALLASVSARDKNLLPMQQIQQAILLASKQFGADSPQVKELKKVGEALISTTTPGGYSADLRLQAVLEKLAADQAELGGLTGEENGAGPHGAGGKYEVVSRTPVK